MGILTTTSVFDSVKLYFRRLNTELQCLFVCWCSDVCVRMCMRGRGGVEALIGIDSTGVQMGRCKGLSHTGHGFS